MSLDFKDDLAETLDKTPRLQYILVAMMPGGIPVIHSNLKDQTKDGWAQMRHSLIPLFAEQNHKHGSIN